MKIILASASPRRKELLKRIYSDFEIAAADIDESIPAQIKNENAPEFLSVQKAKAIDPGEENNLIIAADTIVILNSEILGKPQDDEDAKRMLRLLSGKTHKVITGCCLRQGEKYRSFSVESTVTFYKLTEKDIDTYVSSGASSGKAGAYGIQDTGCLFVKEICGDYYNIVGLPIGRLNQEIRNFLK